MTNGIDPTRVSFHQPDDLDGDAAHVLRNAKPPAPPSSPPDVPASGDDPLARTLHEMKARNVRTQGVAPRQQTAECARLDAFLQKACATYVVDGKSVTVAAPFRMIPGYTFDPKDPKTDEYLDQARFAATARQDLFALASKAGVSRNDVERALYGRAEPEVLRKLTQALIDAGKMPAEAGTPEQRIRRMQFHYGLGFDCAGYTKMAFAAARGVRPEDLPHGLADFRENLDQLGMKGFAKTTWAQAEPGDIVALGVPDQDRVGHRAILSRARGLDDADRARLHQLDNAISGSPATAMLASRNVRVFEVDSSWGCGGDAARGGVSRETWYLDATSNTWLWTQDGAYRWGSTPYNHPVIGVYRWKDG